ncbi:MAG: hypothetical protein ACRD2N_03020 [Vicinamibacterales bacterium]
MARGPAGGGAASAARTATGGIAGRDGVMGRNGVAGGAAAIVAGAAGDRVAAGTTVGFNGAAAEGAAGATEGGSVGAAAGEATIDGGAAMVGLDATELGTVLRAYSAMKDSSASNDATSRVAPSTRSRSAPGVHR